MENFVHNGLKVEFRKGLNRPKFEDDHLIIYHQFTDWSYYQKVDICLDETFVHVTCMIRNGEPDFQNVYLVYDYGAWNKRTFKDMSVIKGLERVGSKTLPRRDRHSISFDFGRSTSGKEALVELCKDLKDSFNVLKGDEMVRFRKWDQTKDIHIRENVTKITLEAGQEILEELVPFLSERGYDTESSELQEHLLKALFETLSIEIDFKERFKKKKAKSS